MKLRWPIYRDKCCECGHASLNWQTPWFKPWVPDLAVAGVLTVNRYLFAAPFFSEDLKLPEIGYSKDAVLHIPHLLSEQQHDD